MKPLVLLISLFLFSACTSTQETTGITLPELIYQHPLPAYPKPLSDASFKIGLKIFVGENGTVRDVVFQNSSGNLSWDSSASQAIRQWKYAPARYENKPISIWLRQTAVVKFSDPLYLLLGEILFNSKEDADSAFAQLETGADFSEIAEKYAFDTSHSKKMSLGSVNIQIFPEHIKNSLLKLERGAYTAPLKQGDQYAIYKRVIE